MKNTENLFEERNELKEYTDFNEAMNAVLNNYDELIKVSYDLIDDKKFVLELLRRDPYIYNKLNFIFPEIAIQKDVIKTAILSFKWIKYGTSDFKIEPKKFSVANFSEDDALLGSSFYQTIMYSGYLSNDKEIIQLCFGVFFEPLRAASEQLRNDRDLVLEAVRENGETLSLLSDAFRNDKEIVMEAVSNSPVVSALEYASDELRNDEDVVLAAVKSNPRALYYASDELRNNKEFILKTVMLSGSLEGVGEQLLKDKDFILEAVKCGAKDYFYVDPEIWADKDFVIEMIKFGANFSSLKMALRDDKDIALAAVKNDAQNFAYLSDELKKDSDILYAYMYASADNKIQASSSVMSEESNRTR